MDLITRIVNLTQHDATPDQIAAGVFNLPEPDHTTLRALLTFDTPPTAEEVCIRAVKIAALTPPNTHAAMIGGASYLMIPLNLELADIGVRTLHSFTKREGTEELQPDGSVKKTFIFRHIGWVES